MDSLVYGNNSHGGAPGSSGGEEEIGKEMACRGNREKNKILETSYESMAENYIDSGL